MDLSLHLIAHDLINGTYWLDVRRVQDPSRTYGAVPTAAWTAFRKVMPWQMNPLDRPPQPPGEIAYRFMKETPAATFYTGAYRVPETETPETPWLKTGR